MSTDVRIMEASNSFAMMADLMFAFLLIPVTKGFNILLITFGVHPIDATLVHIWIGRMGAFGAIVHGMGHTLRYIISEDTTLSDMMIPSQQCWHQITNNDESCYDVFRNFTGVVSVLAYIGILFTSLGSIRRNFYRIFYHCHMFFG